MKQLGLSYFTDTHLTALALLLFFAFFCWLMMWVFGQKQKPYFQHMEMTPLENDQIYGDKNGKQ